MKLYQIRQATNPRRVIIYLAEKGIDVPRYEVNAAANEHKSAAFLALNPAGKVPVLALNDGTALSESAAIVEYLEELYPNPPMIGTTPVQRAHVRALERIGNDLIVRSQLWLMHSHAFFSDRVQQHAEVAKLAQAFALELLTTLEQHIGDNTFLAGDHPSIADCTLFALFQTCRVRFQVPLGEDKPRLNEWYLRFSERPSAAY